MGAGLAARPTGCVVPPRSGQRLSVSSPAADHRVALPHASPTNRADVTGAVGHHGRVLESGALAAEPPSSGGGAPIRRRPHERADRGGAAHPGGHGPIGSRRRPTSRDERGLETPMTTEPSDVADERHYDEFERLGRQAGAELRTPPPADGPGIVQRTAKRRRTTMVAGIAGATVRDHPDGPRRGRPQPADRRQQRRPWPPTRRPPPRPTRPLRRFLRARGPGASYPDSPLGPQVGRRRPVWTGDEAIVLGGDGQGLSAAGYEVSLDQWRGSGRPARRTRPRGGVWAGPNPAIERVHEVLAATSDGQVFTYDPRVRSGGKARRGRPTSRWASGLGPRLQSPLAASWPTRQRVGGGTTTPTTDGKGSRHHALEADEMTLAALDDHTMVATEVDGSMLTSSGLDIESRTWADGPSVQGPADPR